MDDDKKLERENAALRGLLAQLADAAMAYKGAGTSGDKRRKANTYLLSAVDDARKYLAARRGEFEPSLLLPIAPVLVARMPLVLADKKTVEIVPFQIYEAGAPGDRRVNIRVGNNMFFFDADGTFDGPEGKAVMEADHAALEKAYQDYGLGERPEEAYFHESERGYLAETRHWPPEGEPPPPAGKPGTFYATERGRGGKRGEN